MKLIKIMEKEVSVIFIDSINKKVSKRTVKDFTEIVNFITLGKSDYIEEYPLNKENQIIVNDRGIYYPERGGFYFNGFPHFLFGNCVISGYEINDYSRSMKDIGFSLEEVKSRITFGDSKYVQSQINERRKEGVTVSSISYEDFIKRLRK